MRDSSATQLEDHLGDEAPQVEACLSDEALLAFALGRLKPERLEPFHAHLDQCPTCQHLLSEAAHALGSAATDPHSDTDGGDWNTMFQPGALIGNRYLIRNFRARGGMGEVYEAFDRELSERVALKTVTSTACDNPRAVRRLKAEVQLSRRVSHPNVCRIYDLGSHALAGTSAQIHFLTMQFVEGETLGQRIRLSGAVPVPESRKLARELLLGLEAAHQAGILHRDLKSDNIMLRADADGETPVILDFGLARALDHEARSGPSTSNSIVGTFGYIAPEQLEGKALSAASDLYSFGVLFFEMLTGELPFATGSSPIACALDRVRRPAPAPSSVNPRVPATLDAVVLRCLRQAPLERYQSAQEVLEALDGLKLEPAPSASARKRRRLQLMLAAALCGTGAYWAIRREDSNVVPPAPAVVPKREGVRNTAASSSAPPAPPSLPSATSAPDSAATIGPRPPNKRPKRLIVPPIPVPSASASAHPLSPQPSPQASGASEGASPAPSGKKPNWVNPFSGK